MTTILLRKTCSLTGYLGGMHNRGDIITLHVQQQNANFNFLSKQKKKNFEKIMGAWIQKACTGQLSTLLD